MASLFFFTNVDVVGRWTFYNDPLEADIMRLHSTASIEITPSIIEKQLRANKIIKAIIS